jgi:1-deoxy-D-xylulose-5-phosphate reductoisomerase
MRLPIQYALTYPERLPNPEIPRIGWGTISRFDFEEPDLDTFPCFKLAIEAGRKGGTLPAVLCAADEVAVELFLSHRIKFSGIANLIKQVLEQHQPIAQPSIDDIATADAWARDKALELVSGDTPLWT